MKLNKTVKNAFCVLLKSLALASVVVFAVAPFSCKVTTEGIQLLSGDYTPPVIQQLYVTSSTSVEVEFSEKVKVTDGAVYPLETADLNELCGVNGAIPVEIKAGAKDNIVVFLLKEPTVIGKKYQVYGVVKDDRGNELTFALPFSGYNSRIPQIIMTEIQTASLTQTTKEKDAGIFRNEYVEFLCLKEGNLAGLEFLSAYDGIEKNYQFPPVEVKAGEIFIVHLRNRGEGCISEEDDDLSLAYSSYTSNSVRDLWVVQTGTALGNKTDILLVKNSADNSILDAVMYREESIIEWTKLMKDYAALLDNGQIYENGSIENAVITTGMTDSKTLYRVDGWIILNKVLNGEEVAYPVKGDSDSWAIGTETHGIIPTL